ncbi:hypothetical protein EVB64_088 [Rhizobium phage RHph_TM61]|nr:hypothetical protein EVB64_088 [Rhizobium phage RHph_TM61]
METIKAIGMFIILPIVLLMVGAVIIQSIPQADAASGSVQILTVPGQSNIVCMTRGGNTLSCVKV